MASLEARIAQHEARASEIEKIIANIKKAPYDRRTLEFYQNKKEELTILWQAFDKNENSIRNELTTVDDPYIIKDLHRSVSEEVSSMFEYIQSSIQNLTSTTKPPSPAARTQAHQATDDVARDELLKLMRRQAAMVASLERLLRDDFTNQDMVTVSTLWQNIEGLHFQIFEKCDDPLNQGYNLERFLSLETSVRQIGRASASGTINHHNAGHINSQPESIPMPKITLPKFDGNYLKWVEFHDLFSSLIVSQPMPNVQKIWYLKTHLVGEAANLIKHFTATGENFNAAWAIIVDRYNNKRLLVSKLIQELIDAPTKTSSDNYKTLHDKTQECLLALQNLQINTSTWDPLLLHLLLKRLDRNTRLRYEQALLQPRDVPSIKDFLSFLEKHFQSMEALAEKEKSSITQTKVCTSITANEGNSACIMCKGGKHPLFACKGFLKLSPSSRLQFIQKQKYCVNCLKPGHNAKSCILRSCMKCHNKHNTLLHLENSNQNASKLPTTTPNNHACPGKPSTTPRILHADQEAASLTAAKQTKSNSYILLSTAMINVKANGKEIRCRAILDSGSQLNLISERLVNRLGISPKAASIWINGIGASNTKVQHRVNITINSRINNFTTRLEAAVLPHIISPQPSQAINTDHWQIPNTITLADPEFNRPDKIDVLLGAEFYHQLLAVGQIKLASDLPILQNTVLGWVIAGKVGEAQLSTATCGMCTDEESNLEETIAQLWEMENVSPTDKTLSISEKQCENHFAQTHTIDQGGRLVVKLPFCDNPDAVGESHGIAYNRFLALERRLARAPEIKTQYVHFMKEYEALGHMTQIDINSIAKPNYFIPHHCILRPESLTTKLRVVFDASTKTSSGVSLNDLMHTGPTVQSELFSILLRFRLPRFVFTTDIEKMYRQILMHPEDRKFQIIIWREDPATPVKYYQLNTITYGTRSAPYLATKCLEKIAKENKSRYPYGAQFLLENFYVDDGLGGDDNLNIALAIQRELKLMLKQHGLKLQKWNANHQQLLQNIAEEETEVNINFNNENNQAVKTLGLVWMPKIDKFSVKVCLEEIKHVTKRTVCSDLAKLFDPLGILAPIVVTAKMFIQELWQMKLSWDETLPAECQTRWMKFRSELEHINNMKISRHVFEGHLTSNIQIHAFADASEKAYGAAIYIRAVVEKNQVIVRLLCAKSRVAPLKRQTLPRLELCAALLSAQLITRVKKDLKLEHASTYMWTDSEIVLAWINSKSSSYQTFVANRIAAIQELSLAEQWHHVKSSDNPADVLSRGISPRKLATCTLWLYGPIFLHGRQEIWPQRESKAQATVDYESCMEKKKIVAATTTDDASGIIYNIQHNGSFRTLQRIVGYMLKFINNSRKLKLNSQLALTSQELEQALVVIIRAMQQSDFEEDLKYLKKYNEVSKSSQYSNLSPFLDINGIIRVGGRLNSSILPYDAKHPMLIPYNDPITKLLMQFVHEQNRHCGPQALLAHVRQRYWPVKGKSAARSVVQHCVRCARAKPIIFKQIMGDLPSTRVTPARPFINSGVDLCGPFWVHYKIRGKKPQKAYITIFCCFATKAVHLELVSDLTTEAFIGALKRFISRRGHCKNLYCDNATNFVGAKNQLNELSKVIFESPACAIINKECTARGITFHFIPPRAPHFGGLWEAAVKSAKHLLVRSVATASLTYEELDTVVIEIEGILNSRPISPMSNNPNDLAALTPGHFLIGEPLNAQIDLHSTHTKLNLLNRWKLVTHLKGEFWRRWSREYLCELQYRHKWKTQQANVKPGDMVVIKEDNTAPLQWPLGRIEKVHQGDDGLVRVVDVKTSNGVCRRPIARLAPLPVNTAETSEPVYQDNFFEASLSEGPGGAKKKRRLSLNHSVLAVIITLTLIPLALGAKVHNTQFGTQLGIHFEGIGSAAISSTEWQLLVYYDLKEFWSEATIFSQGSKTLKHLCDQMHEKETCTNLVQYFEHTEAELTLDSRVLSGRIHKRAAIDLVGNIAHSLFGVLDSEYAKDMSHTISLVKENEAHLLNLLKNQTSIIDSTINIMKSDQGAIKKKFDQIDYQISQIHNKIHNISEEQYQERIYRTFSSLCIQLTIIAARLQNTQFSILDILTNTHHGIISPLLLTPHQLQHEVERIRFHLPESLELPMEQEDTLQLYKLMKIKGGLTENTVIFSITLPLIEHEQFEIFNIIPIPNWINKTLVSIKPCSSLLAINSLRNQYFTMSDAEFNSCPLIKKDSYLCSKGQIRYEQGSPACACEINLFHNKTRSDCPVQQITDSWIPLRHQNQWIYAISAPSHATAVCNREITELTLNGSGLLNLEPECTLKHKFISVKGQPVISSSLKTSYTQLWEITEQGHEERLKPLLNKIHTHEYISQIQNLTKLQNSLAAQEILHLPNRIEAHNYHHIAIGYSALIITCCIFVYLIIKRKSDHPPTPIPAARTQQTTSDLTVHI